MVSETNVEYQFTALPGNDVPVNAKIFLYFPTIDGVNTIDCTTDSSGNYIYSLTVVQGLESSTA